MQKRTMKIWVAVLAMALAVIFPLQLLSNNVAAAEATELFTITGYDRDDNIYDANNNIIHGHTYCLNRSRPSPSQGEYTRYRLSDMPYSIFDFCTYQHAARYGNEDKTFTAEEDAEVRLLLLNLLIKQDSLDLHGWSMQEIVWFMTCGKFCDSYYVGENYTMDTNDLADIKAQINAEPHYTFSDYDVYYYYSVTGQYQNTLGNLFVPVATSFTIDKTVVDGLDAVEDYNGIDDTLGFTLNLNFFDTLGIRPVAFESFTFTFTDRDGNVTTQTLTTDGIGNLSINILSGQSVDISGFDSVNYRITVSESDANTDSTCNMDSISSPNSTLTDNGDGSYSFDFSQSYVVDIDLVNRHISADPTPVPTATSETTTEATTEATTSETTTEVTTEATTSATSEETTATAMVLGEARTSETSKAADETEAEATATPTPTSAPSGTVATGEASGASRVIAGIVLIAMGVVVFTIRRTRVQHD